MFADPISNLMLVVLLFFLGLLIMFMFIMRSLEDTLHNQDELQVQLALTLNDIESKVAEISYELQKIGQSQGAETPADSSAPLLTQDDLSTILSQLHSDRPALTAAEPANPQKDS